MWSFYYSSKISLGTYTWEQARLTGYNIGTADDQLTIRIKQVGLYYQRIHIAGKIKKNMLPSYNPNLTLAQRLLAFPMGLIESCSNETCLV